MLSQALDQAESLLEKLKEQFGSNLQIDYYGPGRWRVWVHGWHIHNRGPNSGRSNLLARSSSSIEDAARLVLITSERYFVVRGENCEKGKCPHFRDGV